MAVKEFIEKLDVLRTENQALGTTWMELAIEDEQSCGNVCVESDAATSASKRKFRWHTKKVVQTFKLVARRISRQGGGREIKEAFKPHKGYGQPLQRLAIQGKYPMINLLPSSR